MAWVSGYSTGTRTARWEYHKEVCDQRWAEEAKALDLYVVVKGGQKKYVHATGKRRGEGLKFRFQTRSASLRAEEQVQKNWNESSQCMTSVLSRRSWIKTESEMREPSYGNCRGWVGKGNSFGNQRTRGGDGQETRNCYMTVSVLFVCSGL